MDDNFLIKFALATLGAISFTLQHTSQLIARKITRENAKDKNIGMIFFITVMQLASIAIIIEMMGYAFKK
jgi:hypothetical protein